MRTFLFTAFMAISGAAFAAEFTVDQKGNGFNQKVLKIKVGDSVNFKNLDNHYHNVYSLTEGHVFDLGSFGQGQVRKHTFNSPGRIEVECAIHPDMKLVIEVSK